MKGSRSILALVVLLAGCKEDAGRADAERAVRTYVARMADAYRASDESVVDAFVSERQGRKLLGLIGVKRDAGVVLDAKLLALEFTQFSRTNDGWIVDTRERWYYADRRIGTGEQIGEDSTDSYAVRYRLVRKDGTLILDALEFIGDPVVERKSAPIPVDTRVLHGLPVASAENVTGRPAPAPEHPDGQRDARAPLPDQRPSKTASPNAAER